MKEFVIDLKNIIRNFQLGPQTVHVLKGIDLTIKKGEYVALMGPSGSGKSTLMNLLGCLDTPTSGSYMIANRDVSKMNDIERLETKFSEALASRNKAQLNEIHTKAIGLISGREAPPVISGSRAGLGCLSHKTIRLGKTIL